MNACIQCPSWSSVIYECMIMLHSAVESVPHPCRCSRVLNPRGYRDPLACRRRGRRSPGIALPEPWGRPAPRVFAASCPLLPITAWLTDESGCRRCGATARGVLALEIRSPVRFAHKRSEGTKLPHHRHTSSGLMMNQRYNNRKRKQGRLPTEET